MSERVYVQMLVQFGKIKEVFDQVSRSENVVKAFMCTGDFDILLKVEVNDTGILAAFLTDKLEGVQGTIKSKTFLVLKNCESSSPPNENRKTKAFVFIDAEQKALKVFNSIVEWQKKDESFIRDVSLITGEHDLIVDLALTDLDEVGTFITTYLSKLEGVIRTYTFVSFENLPNST